MTPRPPETIYVREDGAEFLVGFLNMPNGRLPARRFTDRDQALRFAAMLKQSTGAEVIVNLGEPLQ